MCRAGSVINLLLCRGAQELVGPGSTRPFRWEPSLGPAAALVGGPVHPVLVTVCVGPAQALADTCRPLDS